MIIAHEAAAAKKISAENMEHPQEDV
jgi:hypothetical protein